MEQPHSYPLEQLAVIKQKKLEEAEKILQEKRKKWEKEQEKLKVLEAERDEVKTHRDDKLQQLRATLDKESSSQQIQQQKQYLKLVDEQLKGKERKVQDQQKITTDAAEAVDAARKEVLKKSQAVEKLRLHRQEWEQEYHAFLQQQENIEADEMGAILHERKQGTSASLSIRPKKGKPH